MRGNTVLQSTALFSIALLILSIFSSSAADGDWPMWRRDSSLTGYQPLPGAMKEAPRVLAKHLVGTAQGTSTFADLRGTGKKEDIIITARARLIAYDSKGKKLWESAPEGYVMDRVEWVDDLDGDGRNEVVAIAGQMGLTRQAILILDGATGQKRAAIEISTGDFSWRGHCGPYLPKEKGKQIFIVTSMRQAANRAADPNGRFSLWSFDGKTVQERWAWIPSEFTIFYPAVMVADLNGDGRFHAVVNSWCRVWHIDLATGTAVSHTTWDPQGANQRQYGWNELVDVDGDSKLDYINIALTKHVDVLRNVDGKLQMGWTRGWPDPVTTEVHAIHSPSDPVVDLDSDGKMELIASFFEGVKEKRWKLWIWNAATGEQKVEVPDLVALASVPLWGTNKGRALLCARSKDVSYDPADTYEVWRLENGQLTKMWESTNAFVVQTVPSTDLRAVYFSAIHVKAATTADVDGDGRVEFFTQQTAAKDKTPAKTQAWGLDAKGSLVAKKGKVPETKPPQLPKRIPPLQGASVPHLLAADLDGQKPNEILLYDNTAASVLRLQKNKLRAVEKIPSTEIPVICDLLGDGKPCLLTGGRGADGNLWIEARDSKKKTLWRFTFPDSGACGQYSERPHFFKVGHFTGGKHLDIATYGTKPSARTYVLDGRTGKMVWEKIDMPAIERHFHPLGGRVSAWDFNKDNADDVIFCNPDFYCVSDGKTGNLLVGPADVQALLGWWAAYASPSVLKHGENMPIVYLGGAYGCRGSIALDGKRGLWHEFLPTERWPLRGGNSGFNEGLLPPTKQRGWRGAQMEADGTIVCFDVETGKSAWKMKMPTGTAGIITGDVNGDGEADLIFGGQDGNLYVLRDAGDHGEIIWRKTFDGPVQTTLMADVNADGRSEIVVSVGDGFVYVLTANKRE